MSTHQESPLYQETGLLITRSRIVLNSTETYAISSITNVRLETEGRGGCLVASIWGTAAILFVFGGMAYSGFAGGSPIFGVVASVITVALIVLLILAAVKTGPKYKINFTTGAVHDGFMSTTVSKTIDFGSDNNRAQRALTAINRAIAARD